MIPKILNLFWSNSSMNFMRFLTLKSFQHYNPDWTIRLFRPTKPCLSLSSAIKEKEDNYEPALDYQPELKTLSIEQLVWNPPKQMAAAHASDIFQWEILSGDGGFYADMDILFVKSLEKIYDEVCDADAVFCLESGGLAIGFLASSPNCKLFQDVKKKAIKLQSNTIYQSTGTNTLHKMARSRGSRAISFFEKKYPSIKIARIDDDVIYPYDWLNINDVYTQTKKLPESTVGIHWFGGDKNSHEWGKKLTEQNMRDFDNTFCHYARRCYASELVQHLSKIISSENTVLDLGCGQYSPILDIDVTQHTTVDIWKNLSPDVRWDLRKTPYPFESKEYDCVVMLDCIEHLDKSAGESMLKEAHRIAKKLLVVFTPLTWDDNKRHVNNPKLWSYQNQFNLHKSLWDISDFVGWNRQQIMDNMLLTWKFL